MLLRSTKYLRYFSDMKPKICYYKSLNIPTYADINTIRRAYLQMVKKFHPDVSKQPNAIQKFNQIQKAYEILSDENAKKQYDQLILKGKPGETIQQKYRTSTEVDEGLAKFRKKYTQSQENKIKDQLNDQYNFSYTMFKKHAEQIQQKKYDYIKYRGTETEYFGHKDYKNPPFYKNYFFLLVIPLFAFTGVYIFPKNGDKQNKSST